LKAVGVVSEFNPFHKGHEYLISRIKEKYPEKPIVAVMSGNFVQRGECAVQEKYSRAKCAVLSGVDLVLEIPFPYSSLSAEAFAAAAMRLLSGIGVCDTLSFGSEVADLSALLRCAENLSTPEFQKAMASYLEEHKGAGYPAARAKVYASLFGETPILENPNASLAVEYLICNLRSETPLSVFPVHRAGSGFHSLEAAGDLISAGACRRLAAEGSWKELSSHVPEAVFREMEREKNEGRFPVSTQALSPILFYLLRTKTRKELSSFYGFSSLCDRAMRSMDGCRTIEDLVEKMGFSGCTDSRIRRGLLSVVLQIPRYAEKTPVSYTQVLAVGEKGRALLSQIRKESTISVFTKPAAALKSSDRMVQKQASAAFLADRIYQSAFEIPHEEGYFLKKMPYLKDSFRKNLPSGIS